MVAAPRLGGIARPGPVAPSHGPGRGLPRRRSQNLGGSPRYVSGAFSLGLEF